MVIYIKAARINQLLHPGPPAILRQAVDGIIDKIFVTIDQPREKQNTETKTAPATLLKLLSALKACASDFCLGSINNHKFPAKCITYIDTKHIIT